MAEEVRIRLTVDGLESISQLRAALKAEKKEWEGLTVGTRAFEDQAKKVKAIKEQLAGATRQAWTESARMKDAYFRAGLELRQLTLSGNLASTSLGKLTSGMSESIINAIQLNRAFVPLGLSLGTIGIAITAFASIIATVVVPAIRNMKDEVETASERIKSFIGATRALGAAGVGGLGVKGHREQADLLKDEEDRVRIRARGITDEVKRVELLSKANELERERLKHEAAIEEIMSRQAEAARRTGEALQGTIPTGVRGGSLPLFPFRSGEAERAFAIRPPSFTSEDEQRDVRIAKKLNEEFERSQVLGKNFTRDLQSGITQATSLLAQGFANAFGLGNSLLDRMLASILGAFASAGLNYLTGGLFGFASGGIIPEPVVGRGMKSGSFYTFAEKGPEYVVPTQGPGAGVGFKPGQVIAETVVRGTDLYILVKRAEDIVANRSVKFG